MPKKRTYAVKQIASREDFEDLIAGERGPLPEGSLLEAVWLLTKYSEKDRGYTVAELADYFKVGEPLIRSAMSGLNKKGYFVTLVVEAGEKRKKGTAGVLRDVFLNDYVWEIALTRRFRQYLLPHMQRIARFGELTALARPHLLPKISSFMNEANGEWTDTRKRLTKSVKGKK